MSAGDLVVVEDLGTVPCQSSAACGRFVDGRWHQSAAARVRVGNNDRVLCQRCGRALPFTDYMNWDGSVKEKGSPDAD
jgi:hypothetical protein